MSIFEEFVSVDTTKEHQLQHLTLNNDDIRMLSSLLSFIYTSARRELSQEVTNQ